MSIPLFVKEGSIVAVGSCDSDAVYDYADGVEYKVYALAEGKDAKTVVYSTENEVESEITVSHIDNRYEISVTSKEPCKVSLVHAGCAVSVDGAAYEQQDDTVVLSLSQSAKAVVTL